MRFRLRASAAWMLILLLLVSFVPAMAATPAQWSSEHPEILEEGHIYAKSVVLMDYETGQILFSKNMDNHMYPASTTKIMTLMLALESGIPMDRMVTITHEAVDIPSDSSKIPVSEGETLSFEDLLYGFMLNSGNDGAIAIALEVSGTVAQFVERMNQRAQELGCTGTHFANPHGYHDDNHFTTASDMAKIVRAAMANPIFRQIVSTPSYQMAKTNKHRSREIKSRVDMIQPDSPYYLSECVGIKTGYTSLAGQCFVSAAKRGERLILSVVLFASRDYAERKWYDTGKLFAYAFTRYDNYDIHDLYRLSDASINTLQVENAKKDDPQGGSLPLILTQTSNDGYQVLTLKDQDELTGYLDFFNQHTTVTLSMDYLDKLENRLTIEAGSIVGGFSTLTKEGEEITGTLIASRSVELEQPSVSLWGYLKERLPFLGVFEDERTAYVLVGVWVLIALLIIVHIVRKVRKNRRRKRIYEQRRRAYYEKLRREGRLNDRFTSRRG